VRRERRVVRVLIGVLMGRFKGSVSPERFLTKICIVSCGSGEAEREEEVLVGVVERIFAGCT